MLAVDVSVAPFNVTDHVVPGGRPLSANVTVCAVATDAVNVIA